MPAKKNAFPSFMDRGNGYLNPMGFALSRKNKGDYFVMPLACIIFAPVMKKILFVCLGNICRSPLVEGYFVSYFAQNHLAPTFFADSAATSTYHVGEHPHSGGQKCAKGHGIDISKHRARQVKAADFFSIRYDYVTEKFVREAHALGKEVHAWTVNYRGNVKRMLDIGVDNIITDDPALVRKVQNQESGTKTGFLELLEYALGI